MTDLYEKQRTAEIMKKVAEQSKVYYDHNEVQIMGFESETELLEVA